MLNTQASEHRRTPAPPVHPAETGPSWKIQFWETLAFLVLISPAAALLLYAMRPEQVGFVFLAVASMLRNLFLLAVIVFFLRRNGEPLQRLGWTARGAGREAWLGLLLFLPLFFAAGLLQLTLRNLGLSGLSAPPAFLVPDGAGQILLALVFVAVVAVTEESIFRGYLLYRFSAVTHSRAAGLLLSTAIFAFGHTYEGTAGVLTVGALGLALGGIYLWRGSLVAPMVVHFLQNLVGILLLPVLAGPQG